MDGERMHAAGKLARQRRVDHAMAFEPALPAKGLGHDIDAEVRFAARPMAGVAFVPVGFVFNAQALGRESLAQLFSDEILGSHRRSLEPDRSSAVNDGDALFCRLSSLEGVAHRARIIRNDDYKLAAF